MTRAGIREYTEAVLGRYLGASKKEKGRILDEFTKVLGYHRKAASAYWVEETDPGRRKGEGVLGNMVLLWLRH